jgi:hypothetical protein
MVCKANTRGILVRARMALRPVDSATTRVALHRSAHSRGYKFLREGVDPMSLLRGGVCVVVFGEVCVSLFLLCLFF